MLYIVLFKPSSLTSVNPPMHGQIAAILKHLAAPVAFAMFGAPCRGQLRRRRRHNRFRSTSGWTESGRRIGWGQRELLRWWRRWTGGQRWRFRENRRNSGQLAQARRPQIEGAFLSRRGPETTHRSSRSCLLRSSQLAVDEIRRERANQIWWDSWTGERIPEIGTRRWTWMWRYERRGWVQLWTE